MIRHMSQERILSLHENYKKQAKKRILTLLLLLVFVFLLSFLSLLLGSSLSFKDSFLALFRLSEKNNFNILIRIRLPRMLAGLLCGGGLAISGLLMQTCLNNPMASPSTLGISNAAVLGANISLLFFQENFSLPAFAFLFGMLSSFFVLFLSRKRNFSGEALILSGLSLSFFFQALTTLLQYFSNDATLASAVYWTFGDLSRASLSDCLVMGVVVFSSFLFLYAKRWSLNGLSLGEIQGRSLGLNTKRLRFLFLLIASLVTGGCLCYLGIIGFVGLIAPHIGRKIFTSDHKYLLPGTLLLGQILLLFSDNIARLFFMGLSLPVGAICSLFGAPFFLFLIIRKEKASC